MTLTFNAARADRPKERILLLGPLCKDPILSALSSAGLGYANKAFNSSPKNWETIANMIRDDSFSAVLAQLTETTLILATSPSYKSLLYEIVQEMARRNHAILVYAKNLHGDFTSLQSEDSYSAMCVKFKSKGIGLASREDLRKELRQLINYLAIQSLRLIPYSFTPDLISLSLAFLQEIEKGLVVRFYVPTRRIYARELDKLIDLLQDYFSNVVRQPVSLEKRKTGTGVVYSVFSQEGCAAEDLRQSLADLSSLLYICANDPERASTILSRMDLSQGQITEIVSRYGREARRIAVDIEYERRTRLLAIEHQLHAELVETASDAEIASAQQEAAAILGNQVDIYAETRLSDLISGDRQWSSRETLVALDQNAAQRARSVVWENLEGTRLEPDDVQIIKLINGTSSGDERGALLSAFYELKDRALTKTERMSAGGKIRALLARASPMLGSSMLRIVENYIAQLVTRGM